MSSKRSKLSFLIIFCVVFQFPKLGISLITGEHGNRPIQNRGWPAGSVEAGRFSRISKSGEPIGLLGGTAVWRRGISFPVPLRKYSRV
jgi:hypothetical protein